MVDGEMKVIMAENIGFCFGVERAYKMSLGLLGKGDCQMLGHLVHNERVVDELKSKGLRFASSVDEIGPGTVIIRAHGVGDDTMDRLRKAGREIVDATCPLVRRAQNFARLLESEGKKVVIIGERGHAEVEAINGSIRGRAVIIENEDEIGNIPEGVPLGIVVQTTKDRVLAERLVGAVKARFNDVEACNTLCQAVLKRQEEVKELAKKVDIILVVGSVNSANTQTLVKVAQRETAAHGVEGPEDIKKEWLDGAESVGLISGTSAPIWLIDEVKKKIESIK